MRAARGQREVDGRAEDLADPELAGRVRAVARRIPPRALLLAALAAAAVALCPA